jgi:hypothetical protein
LSRYLKANSQLSVIERLSGVYNARDKSVGAGAVALIELRISDGADRYDAIRAIVL